jgi:hypothetical protein
MIKKSKLSEAIAPCVKIFQFFGYADCDSSQPASAVWILIKFLVMNGFLGFLFMDSILGQINRLRDSNGITIHLINYVLTAMEAFVVLSQSLRGSFESIKFVRDMKRVDELLVNGLSITMNYDDLRWSLLVKVITSLAFQFVCSAAVISSAMKINPHLWRIASNFFIPILLGVVFAQRFIFMVELLTFYLNVFAAELEKSINSQPLLVLRGEGKQWKWNMKANHMRVKVMQRAYRFLWRASVSVNKWSGFGLAYIFFRQSLTLLYQGYTVCIDITTHRSNERHLIFIAMTIIGTYMTHHHCQQCLNSVSFLIFNSHDSRHDDADKFSFD